MGPLIGARLEASILHFQVGRFFPSQLRSTSLVALLKGRELRVGTVSDTIILKGIYTYFAWHALKCDQFIIIIFLKHRLNSQ
jgi:hypothetical protein